MEGHCVRLPLVVSFGAEESWLWLDCHFMFIHLSFFPTFYFLSLPCHVLSTYPPFHLCVAALGQVIYELCTVSFICHPPRFNLINIPIRWYADKSACSVLHINDSLLNCWWMFSRLSRREIIKSRCWVSRWSSIQGKWRSTPCSLRSWRLPQRKTEVGGSLLKIPNWTTVMNLRSYSVLSKILLTLIIWILINTTHVYQPVFSHLQAFVVIMERQRS